MLIIHHPHGEPRGCVAQKKLKKPSVAVFQLMALVTNKRKKSVGPLIGYQDGQSFQYQKG